MAINTNTLATLDKDKGFGIKDFWVMMGIKDQGLGI